MTKMSEGPQTKNRLKEFGITTLSVNNSTSIFLLAIMIFILGTLAYIRMPKEQFPEATLPTVYINTPYFGNSASEIENLVTRPLEKQIENISGIKNVNSTSIQDFSVIIAEFEADLDIEAVVRKVKDAVDKAKQDLPTDLTEEPSVLEINFSDIPIVTINISGDYSNDDLKRYAEDLQDRIENINQVSKVNLKGALDREMRVDVDLLKMQSLKVSFNDIENAISAENLTMSGGEILNNDFKRGLRVVGQFESADQIANMIVKSENQRPIVLKDIAQVYYGYQDRTSYSRSDGLPVISLDVIKRKGQNLLEAADQIDKELNEVKAVFPDNLKISVFNDQSINTRREVNNLENNIISGVILVTLVLLFFLGLRNASFVGIAIPMSMVLGFLILNLMGITLNIVVLFALVLALGMLVDNAIVAVENMYRYMQEGYTAYQAAKFGVGEIAVPIIASTATTLAAFIPLGFWPGIMGEFMKYFPLTLIIVLTSSLFVALVINPVFAKRFMEVESNTSDDLNQKRALKKLAKRIGIYLIIMLIMYAAGVQWLGNLAVIVIVLTLVNHFLLTPIAAWFQRVVLPWLENNYDDFVRWSLGRPFLMMFVNLGLLILSLVLMVIRQPKVEFFPNADPQYINAFIELPLGSDIEATNKVVKDIEAKIENRLKGKRQIVDAVLTQVGENTSDPNAVPEPGVTPNKARITISFVQFDKREGISTTDILNELRQDIKGYPGVQVVFDKNADGPPAGKPINIEVRGESVDSLIVLSDRMVKYINGRNIGGIEELKSDIKIGKPELLVNIDREAARRYELSTYSIASAIRTSVFGKEVSKFKDGEDEFPITVRLDDKSRNDIEALMNQKITFRNPANGKIVQVPISAVAKFEYSSTYSSIKRKNSERMVTIASNVLSSHNSNEVVSQIKSSMEQFKMPSGYTYEFTGEQQQQAEDMGFLSSAFLIAIFLIFFILVSQFNSFAIPFIIMMSVFLSVIGVFLGYSISGSTISIIFSGVGIISLAGVVVNNAIVLLDFILLEKKRRAEELGLIHVDLLDRKEVIDIIIKSGGTRLRPVLLTAITTVLGLIPLAIGLNINFFSFVRNWDPEFFIGGDNTAIWGPMAWTVIYGLTFATFLTLVIVPVMYWIVYRLIMRFSYGSKRYHLTDEDVKSKIYE